jgi:hypothetical protein
MSLLRCVLLLTLVALLGSCSMFDYSGIVTNKYALVYGVTRYILNPITGPTVNDPNLTYPDVDAKDVAAMLTSAGYTVYKSRWVDDTGEMFVNGVDTGAKINDSLRDDRAPTMQAIEGDIASLGTQIGPNDTFVFYFSGHGMPNANPSTHEWFVPYWGIQYSSTDNYYYGYPQYSIEDNEFGGVLSASIGTPRKVVILDTCNSGGFVGNSLETDITPVHYTGGTPIITPAAIAEAIANYAAFQSSPTGISPYNAQVLAAAGSNESSYEVGPPISHGIMTYYLLQAADQGDLNHDGHLTVLEAFSFVKAAINTGWNSDPGVILYDETFSPHISGGPVDFVLF